MGLFENGFDDMFDFNDDGKLDDGELAMELEFIDRISQDKDPWDDDDFDDDSDGDDDY